MLYPLLHRLERLGQVESNWWWTPPSGRRRKHYRLSAAGEDAFAEQRRQWAVVTDTLRRVWTDRTERGLALPDGAGA